MAEAATLAVTQAVTATGIAYQGTRYSVRASTDCMIAAGRVSMAKRPMTVPSAAPSALPSRPSSAASASRSRTMGPRRPPIARSIDSVGRRCATAMLMAL